MATVDHPVPPSTGTVPPSTGAAPPSADASQNAVAPPSAGAGPSGSIASADIVWPDLEGNHTEKEGQDEDEYQQDWQYPGHRDWWRRGQDWSWQDTGSRTSISTDAKGYLPKVPGYDGDRQKNPKGF